MKKICRFCSHCADDSIMIDGEEIPTLYCWENMEMVTEDMTCSSFNPLYYTCETCKWHEPFSFACFNADSPDCADFTDKDSACEFYEEKE